ncbi:MAG: HTH-type transcriptional regulator CatM [Burkholderia plantarii]|nr:MAG: HTH-type transcriptional regulator CatM [Burkholderia plantarii]
MDLKPLRYFIAVAEELHFGRAAKRLFISQPALSFDIRKLERELGVQLLTRTSKSVALTNAGAVLLDEARRLLLQADEARRLTVRSASGLAGRLRVGFVNSMLYRGLPEAVARFEAHTPNVEVVLKEMNTQDQVLALQRGQIDLGYAHWGRFPAEVTATTLQTEPFVACLSASHRFASCASLPLARLADAPFILFPRDAAPHYHDLIVAHCVAAGFSPQIRHEARLWQTVLSMVGFGMGVALVPRTLRHVDSERLAFVPLEDAAAFESRTLQLTLASGPREHAAAHFADYLNEAIRATACVPSSLASTLSSGHLKKDENNAG